ncbi:enoyl-CoA hydratase/isomerase family protein [Sneathiella chinensis]|uniref:Enoyl-CoA hydratase n=1 Tax=Sneathiella chinensis TaxID=349750 RepID=A0ABQ5TZ29_9PROT|nr:enoyl-CoA hydratase/isomerase family protein [Sneathiella chinensis]GLQ05130.1 enoyl-CoA hydratase [Sneathiella chinensis]
MAEYETIRLEKQDGLAILTLNRPDKKNAIDLRMREELPDALRDLTSDEQVFAIILTGAGGSFCAGGDISVMREMKDGVTTGRDRMRRTGAFAVQMATLDKPLIAAVEGPAFGAGFGMALAADFVLAGPTATFCASFAKLGLIGDFGLHYSLPRRVGLAAAKEILFSARMIGAEEALSLGLAYRVVQTGSVLEAAKDLAEGFRGASPLAVGVSKTLLDQSFAMDMRQVVEAEAAGQALCFASEYHKDAANRFLNKKPPRFKWSE